jgi:hypothetical protein
MKRREFIGVAAAGAAGLVLPVVAGETDRATTENLATPQLLEILRAPHVVREIGECYRQSVPAEDSRQAIEEAIRAELNSTRLAPIDQRLRDQVQRDFTHGRTITVNGWILSVTEARQCALFSLLRA